MNLKPLEMFCQEHEGHQDQDSQKKQNKQDNQDSAQSRDHPNQQEYVSRAVLTSCVNGADVRMLALIKGCINATEALRWILESMPEHSPAQREHANNVLDGKFINGCAKWGRKASIKGMQSFHNNLESWQAKLHKLPSADPDTLFNVFTRHGELQLCIPGEACWPNKLQDLAVRSDWAPPLCLWIQGNKDALYSCEEPLAVVGSRSVSDYGKYVASHIAYAAASQGHTVVSGGAMGTDASAHWGALHAREEYGQDIAGTTIAVFAGGLNHIGPTCNMPLFEAIEASGGALVSELVPDAPPEPRRFLLRNRIIAALSHSVVVAQARLRSGALNTASWANELSREVYAAPGNINQPDNAGCNELIRNQQAILLADATQATETCHASHEPRHNNASGSVTTPNSTPDPFANHPEFALIAQAIQQCKRQGLPPNANTISRYLADTLQEKAPSLQEVMRIVGTMELNGLLHNTAGSIAMS